MSKSHKRPKKEKVMKAMNEMIHEMIDDVEPSHLIQYLNDFIVPEELLKGTDKAYSGLTVNQYLIMRTFFKALDGDDESIRTILMMSSGKKEGRPKDEDPNPLYR